MRIDSTAARLVDAPSVTTVRAMADALSSEAKLLGDLVSIMRSQRDAVARDDLDAVDDSVFGTHRVLLTLSEVRRRRRSINHMLGEGDDLSISALDDFFGGATPPEVRAAAEQLAESARNLQREVEVNRRILRRAVEQGDQYIRSLCGVPGETKPTYAPSGRNRSGGAILDRTV